MPCDCRKITKVGLCRHKERIVEKCGVAEFKRNHSCLGALFPKCRPLKRALHMKRVCKVCHQYFADRFDEEAPRIVKQFLAYKELKGWTKAAMDPESIPAECYLDPKEKALWRLKGTQPFRAKSPMAYSGPLGPLPPVPSYLAPTPDEAQERFKMLMNTSEDNLNNPSVESFDLAARGELPSDYDYSPETSHRKKARTHNYPPVVEHGTGEIIDLDDLVDAEPEYVPAPQAKVSKPAPVVYHQQPHQALTTENLAGNTVLYHPKPKIRALRHVGPKIEQPDSKEEELSEVSLVKRLTQNAATMRIEGYATPEPAKAFNLESAPRGRRGRTPPPGPPPSTYFVHASHDRTSPTGSSVRGVSVPPPQRLDGVLVPVPVCEIHGDRHDFDCRDCRGHYFKEVGVPSDLHRLGCRSTPPQVGLVSVSTPVSKYSCAVQACYCDGSDDDDDKCLSCHERERLGAEMESDWI
ncbi:Uu.00g114500.m01.CDS01 [Anthostomella pinea]|uniref:Uu.00g114500.m01.CDS01 n=1 Tax=Anthostomella pinea TaxID=933095 RepID=A0AAI8VG68_9PEZI|nr:Uu.00g114500.m01.CDS01 [Anthostomella pinea]